SATAQAVADRLARGAANTHTTEFGVVVGSLPHVLLDVVRVRHAKRARPHVANNLLWRRALGKKPVTAAIMPHDANLHCTFDRVLTHAPLSPLKRPLNVRVKNSAK